MSDEPNAHPCAEPGSDDEDARRVLVMRPGAIGDTLATLPALLALCRRFPFATIEMVGNAAALPLVEATGTIDGWIGFDDGRVTRLFMPGQPRSDDHFLGIDVAVAWGRDADGSLRTALERRGARRIVVAPSRPDASRPEHVARHLLRSLAPLGIESDELNLELPELRLPPDVAALARAELATADLLDRPFVALHPGSGSPAKNWPAERCAEVADALLRQRGVPSVILGGPADSDALVVLHDRTGSAPHTLVDRPLLLVAAVLRQAAAFLGNDSGLSHLAGLLGVPTVALFGPSDPVLWAPLGPRVRVVRSASLATLPADVVLGELDTLLAAGC